MKNHAPERDYKSTKAVKEAVRRSNYAATKGGQELKSGRFSLPKQGSDDAKTVSSSREFKR